MTRSLCYGDLTCFVSIACRVVCCFDSIRFDSFAPCGVSRKYHTKFDAETNAEFSRERRKKGLPHPHSPLLQLDGPHVPTLTCTQTLVPARSSVSCQEGNKSGPGASRTWGNDFTLLVVGTSLACRSRPPSRALAFGAREPLASLLKEEGEARVENPRGGGTW